MTPTRTYRPLWPGLDGPRRIHPERVPSSFRRTTTIDIAVSDDLSTLTICGTGRDFATDSRRTGQVLDTARIEAELKLEDRSVTRLEGGRNGEPLDFSPLVGTNAGSGFRKALHTEFGASMSSGSLLALLLDDVPVAAVISGMAVVRARSRLGYTEDLPRQRTRSGVDVCAGWKAGSLMTLARSGEGAFDFGAQGPIMPAPESDTTDPLAWHHSEPIGLGCVRRRRRLDIWKPATRDCYLVDVWFRDSFGEDSSVESGVHEYDVVAVVEPGTHVLLEVEARPRVLPAPECPSAVASAQRVVGVPLASVRDFVRSSFTGPSTCTHLNDSLRAMGDLFVATPLLDALNEN